MLTRRAALLAALAGPLVGCGASETDQRRAFIAFLQTRIIDKPGLHVPRLTQDEMKSFGDYAKHYAVIRDFHDGLETKISPGMEAAVQRGMIRSVAELITRRKDLIEVRQGMVSLSAEFDRAAAAADAAKAALVQPADLKAVYDQAYDRTVSLPVRTLKSAFGDADESFGRGLELADYLEQHHIPVNGSMIQLPDLKLQPEVNKRLTAMTEAGAKAMEAQQRLFKMVHGG